jgi:hypothetical protein
MPHRPEFGSDLEGRIAMTTLCACGAAVGAGVDELGCIECSRPCCRACGVVLESVMYCPPCASALLDAPPRIPLGALGAEL